MFNFADADTQAQLAWVGLGLAMLMDVYYIHQIVLLLIGGLTEEWNYVKNKRDGIPIA